LVAQVLVYFKYIHAKLNVYRDIKKKFFFSCI
jgi:hypothetical protein